MSEGRKEPLEAQLRAARERGEFNHLPGHGKPLQLDDLDHLRPAQRFEALLMRNLGEVPGSVALVREIRACRKLIERSKSQQECDRASRTIREKISEVHALLKDNRQASTLR